MAHPSDGSKKRARKFLFDERRDLAVSMISNFEQRTEVYGGSRWKKERAGDSSKDSQPTSASIFSELTGLPLDLPPSSKEPPDARRVKASNNLSETNIGFKLLKKSGWKEGSGLGVFEQGRLNPLEAPFKLDRRGIGAERKSIRKSDGKLQREASALDGEEKKSKKELKMEAEANRMQEAAFARDFFREFWPENL
ncbi:hypothetical protein MPTK2_1g19540 [Marchantia polymorpha subsp. ruderalis]